MRFADFNEALRLDPKNAWGFAARGNLYKSKGDFDRALTDLNEAIRLDPGYALAYFSRGELYKEQGRSHPRHVRHERHAAARSQLCGRLLHPRPAVLPARQRAGGAGRLYQGHQARRRRSHRRTSTGASLITSSAAATRMRSPISRRPPNSTPRTPMPRCGAISPSGATIRRAISPKPPSSST